MNALTPQSVRLVPNVSVWIDQASHDEVRAAYTNERALSALISKRYVDAMDQVLELRTLLRQVVDHPHSKGHPLYGEALAVLNRIGSNADRV